jgi:hypothetical protein
LAGNRAYNAIQSIFGPIALLMLVIGEQLRKLQHSLCGQSLFPWNTVFAFYCYSIATKIDRHS